MKTVNLLLILCLLFSISSCSNNTSEAECQTYYQMEQSFQKASKLLTDKNKETHALFIEAVEDPAKVNRAKKWADKAQQVRDLSFAFCKLVEKYKTEIVVLSGGRKDSKSNPFHVSEMDNPSDVKNHSDYLGLNSSEKSRGDSLCKLMETTCFEMLHVLNGIRNDSMRITELRERTAFKSEFRNGNKNTDLSWKKETFGHLPVAGVLAMLSKIQVDCKSLESEVLICLAENIGSTRIECYSLALSIAEASSVKLGSNFKAKIALMKFYPGVKSIRVNGEPIKVVDNVGEYTVKATKLGVHKVEAIIETEDQETGEPLFIQADPLEYEVFDSK